MNIIRRLKKLKLNNKGMSLIEVVVAVTVFTIVALPTMQVFASSSVTNLESRMRQRATTVGESVIESFKAYDMEALCTQYKKTAFKGVTQSAGTTMRVKAYLGGYFNGTNWDGGSWTIDNGVFCPDETLKPDGRIYEFMAYDVISEEQHYDVKTTCTLRYNPEVIRMDSPNAYSDAIIKLGEAFNEDIQDALRAQAEALYLTAFPSRNADDIRSVDYSDFERVFTIDVTDVGGVQTVKLKVDCKAKADVHYEYNSSSGFVSGVRPFDADDMAISMLLPDDISTETEWLVYDNSATIANEVVHTSRQCKLNQIYLYFCPAHEHFFGSGATDEIVVNASLSSLYDPSVSEFPEATGHTPLRVNITKQTYSGAPTDAYMNLQEQAYSARVEGNISGGGEAILVSNFDKNISGVASPSPMTPVMVSGFSENLNYADGFKEDVNLVYDVVVTVYEQGTTKELAQFEGTMNE